MSESEFLQLHLSGDRFAEGAIPCSLLQELLNLEGIILSAAKDSFLVEHPDRKNLPKNFLADLELNLTGVERGSIKLGFDFRQKEGQQSLSGVEKPNSVWLEKAKNVICNAVDASSDGSTRISAPDNVLSYLGKMADYLTEDECIFFDTSSRPTPAKLTNKSKERLIQAISQVRTVRDEINLRGAIYEVNQEKMTFELRSLKQQRITGSFGEKYLPDIISAFNEYKDGGKVLIHGSGEHKLEQQIVTLNAIHNIAKLNPLDVPFQLDNLRNMKNGWLDGDGIAPPKEGLDWLAEQFDANFPNNLLLPHVFPTLDGGVEMEWSHGRNAIFLEIDLESHKGDWLWFDRDSDESHEKELDLNDFDSWKWLVDEIRNKSMA